MCGIFGIISGQINSPEITFKALKDIEYRGYDSWGLAFPNGKGFDVIKKTGFLPSTLRLPPSNISIGHTRWATHGGVTDINAHPHTDCTNQLVLVHNGIVENYLELKKSLKGHKIKSETDTEIVVHLIEDQYRKSKDLVKATASVFSKLEGLSAVVVTNGKDIVACKKGSPLVVGKLEDGFVLASDPNALLPLTKNLLFLEEEQMVVLNSSIELIDIQNDKKLNPDFKTVPWEHTSSSMNEYPHFMIKEIHEQPQVVRNILGNLDGAEKVAEMIKNAYGTYFIACGSASYTCLLGTYLFSKYAKKHVNFAIGSEFNYLQDFLTDKSLLIAVSQSGESIDTLEPVIAAKKKGVEIVGLVNVLGSSLYRIADYPLLLSAGVEKAVASTKAVIAMDTYMILLSFILANKKAGAIEILQNSIREIEKIIENKSKIQNLAEEIYKSKDIYVLGRGLSYPIALECTLKIKEISYIHAEGFAGGELKHGTIALVEKGTPVIVYAPNDETFEASISNAMEVKARGAYVIGVGYKNNPVFDYFFEIVDTGASSVLPNIVFAQLLGYYLTLKRKLDPDKPRNLAKSVVVR